MQHEADKGAPVQDWLVISMVTDASFGPFTEAEAKRFAGRNSNYAAFSIKALRRDIHLAARLGIV